jgi:uracil-DNA glycosylase family 4
MNMGYFDLGIGENPTTSKARSSKKRIGCDACSLDRSCIHPNMKPYGRGRKKILLVGEAPGEKEDDRGIPFIGPSGQLIKEVLDEIGISFTGDCIRTNAVICRPPKNRTPTNTEVASCRHKLLRTIAEYKPEVIITFGTTALKGLIGHRMEAGRITGIETSAFFGYRIPDQELGCYICPTYHPAYILRKTRGNDGQEINQGLKRIWKRHIKRAVKCGEGFFYEHHYDKDVEFTLEEAQAIEWIQQIQKDNRPVVFDYETTGVKPHREGHRIVCAGISDGLMGYSFPFFDSVRFRSVWKSFLTNPKVGKIAHKLDFEDNWTFERAVSPGEEKYRVENWAWDTLLGAHCLNNKKPTGLKFLSYVHFGIMGYDVELDDFISSNQHDKKKFGKNAFNEIHKAPTAKLLKYCAQDALFTYKEYEYQKSVLRGHREKGLRLLIDGTQTLARLHTNGIRLDTELAEKHRQTLTRRMKRYKTLIMDSEEVSKWKGKSEFNPNSEPNLSELLYNILGYKGRKGVDGEEIKKVDEATLESFNSDFCDHLIKYRKNKKLRDTYLNGFCKEEVDYIVHPFFKLNNVDTFRSSSDSPNFQNVPKRSAEGQYITRSILKPSPGNRLVEYDYKALEVTIAGCVFQDPTWLEYCRDLSKDMHRDTAMEILYYIKEEWDALPKEISKAARQAAKNGYVFPSIYGSSGRKAAAGMWPQLPEEVKEHLKKIRNKSWPKGIQSFRDFEARMVEYDQEYWGNRYPIYGKKKMKLYDQYERKGFIDQVTGFRCYGPMDFTQVVNYPVQGPASHVKLWALHCIEKELRERNMKSKPIAEVHDSMLFDVVPGEEKALDEMVHRLGSKNIEEQWDWVIAPLILEKERSAVDGSWHEMEDCGYLKEAA